MLAAILGIGCVVAAVTQSPLAGSFITAALAISVWRLFVPVTFDIGSRGIVQTLWSRQRRIPWHRVAGYEVLSRGVLLSPESERTALTPLRSIYVRWNDKKSELLEVLDFYLRWNDGAATGSYGVERNEVNERRNSGADEASSNPQPSTLDSQPSTLDDQ
jgi:hypothetical protein